MAQAPDVWVPPSYMPTVDERRRAYERMLIERAADEGINVEAARAAYQCSVDPWPRYADPADLERFR